MPIVLEERQKISQKPRIESFTISKSENQFLGPLSLHIVVEEVKVVTE